MKKRFIPLFLLLPLVFTGCANSKKGEEGKDGEDGGDTPSEELVTVNFYLDFNQKPAKIIYYTEKVSFGSKITKPADPASPIDPAYPVFKGWSTKEIIDDEKDLFDFNTKLTEDNVSYTKIFEVFGIWVAQGE